MITLDQLKAMTVPERLAAFVAWLGTQPRETPYDFNSVEDCALCKFGRSLGAQRVTGGTDYFRPGTLENEVFVFPSVEERRALIGTDAFDRHPVAQQQRSKTLGELHDRLVALTPTEVAALTDAEMEAIELRPLVATVIKGPTITINGKQYRLSSDLKTKEPM